ncbi:polysaccharide deacetylase family protein [uncultured Thiodictyon sp.]|uniref:polysaccharide deacetylase family protein n=1 Tax=uncultured Thiodictyon sp. TaxID=1846217 RepID=UPI0025E9791B|nr:polysaccharide deacetylase family protein [uncultured Thiodictyon sp.]
MTIALKVDVDTLRGTLEGVPRLLQLFDEFQVRATFLFSLGPDHTGRALWRVFRPGFLAKVRRTSVAHHYGLKTLLYGTLLPGPDIARRGGAVMRACAAAGHEVGVHVYDHIKWQDQVANRDAHWTERELRLACDAFERVFSAVPKVHGAAGWQINPNVLALEQRFGFDYASDTRGTCPYYPILNGVRSTCPQLPTTLPTLDELIGCDGITEANVQDHVFAASRDRRPHGHVYTLHAELEGQRLLPVMRALLKQWLDSGPRIVPLRSVYETLDLERLPTHQVDWRQVPGRSGLLAVQGVVVS